MVSELHARFSRGGKIGYSVVLAAHPLAIPFQSHILAKSLTRGHRVSIKEATAYEAHDHVHETRTASDNSRCAPHDWPIHNNVSVTSIRISTGIEKKKNGLKQTRPGLQLTRDLRFNEHAIFPL